MKGLNSQLAEMLMSIQARRKELDLEVSEQEDLDIRLEKIEKNIDDAYYESFKL